jgi:hypothetical protein
MRQSGGVSRVTASRQADRPVRKGAQPKRYRFSLMGFVMQAEAIRSVTVRAYGASSP